MLERRRSRASRCRGGGGSERWGGHRTWCQAQVPARRRTSASFKGGGGVSSGSNQKWRCVVTERTEDGALLIRSVETTYWSPNRVIGWFSHVGALNTTHVTADRLDLVPWDGSVPSGVEALVWPVPSSWWATHGCQHKSFTTSCSAFVVNSSPWRLIENKWFYTYESFLETLACQGCTSAGRDPAQGSDVSLNLWTLLSLWGFYLFCLIYTWPVRSQAAVMIPVWCRCCAG